MCCITNIEKAVECIKIIVDKNRCVLCDNIDGKRVRYQCGHLYCNECVAKADHCLLCLTPPNAGQQISSLDNSATRRADNAAELLKTFEEAFKINVYKRSRASEQLKAEKELFPQCIQAPIKYFNKRKSFVTPSNKENRSRIYFSGEQISPVKVLKMENSFNYVQQWLDNNEKDIPHKSPRKPFADLNNQSIFKRGIPKRADLILEKTKSSENFAKKRKLSAFKSSKAIVNSQSLLDQYLTPVKKRNDLQIKKKDFDESLTTKLENMNNKTEKDESGIVVDEELIVIDDSQTSIVDKDKLALLAVMEANNEMNPSQSRPTVRLDFNKVINVIENIQPGPYKKVPFYKRSYLTERCNLCKESIFDNNKIRCNDPNQKTKDVSICIENSSFTTSIKITTIPNKPIFNKKHSVCVQTNISDNITVKKVVDKESNENKSNKIVLAQDNHTLSKQEQTTYSQDLFITEPKTSGEHQTNKQSLLANEILPNAMHRVIADSDSDDAANDSSLIQVTAEVHHSNEQLKHGILVELDQTEVHQRTKRSAWENTPNSSDSSDKENYDPNRSKRVKLDKKNTKKRKIYDIFELNSIENMNE